MYILNLFSEYRCTPQQAFTLKLLVTSHTAIIAPAFPDNLLILLLHIKNITYCSISMKTYLLYSPSNHTDLLHTFCLLNIQRALARLVARHFKLRRQPWSHLLSSRGSCCGCDHDSRPRRQRGFWMCDCDRRRWQGCNYCG